MKIVVFGSTGRVGSSFTAKAAAAGHQVVAFARRADMVKVEGVHPFQGDVRDHDAVRTALSQGCDAVVCCIGEAGLKPSTIVTDAFTSIIDAMTGLGLKRFLAVSGSAEMKQMTMAGKIYTAILKRTPVGHAIRDHDGGLKVVQQSSLEWTLAGCNYLSDGPERGTGIGSHSSFLAGSRRSTLQMSPRFYSKRQKFPPFEMRSLESGINPHSATRTCP